MSSSSLAFDELPRGTGGTGATEAISQVLHDAGLDAPASLFDEALALAREGRLNPAAERLRMLLVLDPSDADAALLLGKVLASMARWQEALTWLDAAAANGAVLPPGLRDEVADSLRREVQSAEAERQRLQARERGEVRSLRSEAKRLRTENAILDQRLVDLDKRVKLWSGATVIVAGCASALLLTSILFSGPDVEEPVAEALTVADAAPADIVAEDATPRADAPTIETLDPAGDATATTEAPKKAAAKPKAEAPKKSATAAYTGPLIATHTVKSGENLSVIARNYYGRQSEWKKILDANYDLLRGDHRKLRPGHKLKIPK